MSPISIAFPGYVPDVHAADALDPAWGNAIRDRAPQVFTTQATLTAGVTAPQVGQSAVITVGTGAFTGMASPGEYIYAGATDGWRPPWNSGWGEVARTRSTADDAHAATTAETNCATVATTLTAVANRLYRFKLNAAVTPAGAQPTFTVKIKADGVIIEAGFAWKPPANPGVSPFYIEVEIGTLLAGARAITVTCQSSVTGFTLSNSVYAATLVIDDIGPAGAPS